MEEQKADINLGDLEVRDRLLRTTVTKVQLIRLAMKGLNATQAAKVVGVSPETARAYYAETEFRREVLKRVDEAFADIDSAFISKRKSLHEMLEEQAYKSCEDLIEMLEDKELHPSLRMRINQDFLNRVEETAPGTRAFKLDPQELQHASKVAQEMDKVVEIRKKA